MHFELFCNFFFHLTLQNERKKKKFHNKTVGFNFPFNYFLDGQTQLIFREQVTMDELICPCCSSFDHEGTVLSTTTPPLLLG